MAGNSFVCGALGCPAALRGDLRSNSAHRAVSWLCAHWDLRRARSVTNAQRAPNARATRRVSHPRKTRIIIHAVVGFHGIPMQPALDIWNAFDNWPDSNRTGRQDMGSQTTPRGARAHASEARGNQAMRTTRGASLDII